MMKTTDTLSKLMRFIWHSTVRRLSECTEWVLTAYQSGIYSASVMIYDLSSDPEADLDQDGEITIKIVYCNQGTGWCGGRQGEIPRQKAKQDYSEITWQQQGNTEARLNTRFWPVSYHSGWQNDLAMNHWKSGVEIQPGRSADEEQVCVIGWDDIKGAARLKEPLKLNTIGQYYLINIWSYKHFRTITSKAQ